MMNVTCYAVNNGRKWEVYYDGHGQCRSPGDAGDPGNADKLYDLGHQDYFDFWGVKADDKRAHLACKECAASIKIEVDSYEELMCANPSAKTLAKQRLRAKLNSTRKQVEEMKRKRSRYEDLITSLDEKLAKKQALIQTTEDKLNAQAS